MNAQDVETVALFGLPVTNVTMKEAVALVESYVVSGLPHQIATANLDFARHSLEDERLQRVLCDCAMVLPDGAPLLWASRLMRTPLKERVTGVDLVPKLAELSAAKGYRMYVLGSSEQSAVAAVELLKARYPGLVLAGRYSPPLASLEKMDHDDLLHRIHEANPDILLVAFGNPKQEFWMHMHRDRLKVPVMIGIGGTLDMIAGSLTRAPKWVQKLQMEWIYRMMQEPRRLLPRYWHDGLALLRHLPILLLAHKVQPRGGWTDDLEVIEREAVRIVTMPENLSGERCARLQREVLEATKSKQGLVLDMSATRRIEADGLGALLQARRTLRGAECSLWLTGVTRPVRRVLKYCAMAKLFTQAATKEEAIRQALLTSYDAEWAAHETKGLVRVDLAAKALARTGTR